MDIRRLLHNPDDGGWFVIGETRSEAEMVEFRRSLKRNAIINTHLVNCTMNHDNALDASRFGDLSHVEHKMKVQWTKCTSALCHPKTQDDEYDEYEEHHYSNNNSSSEPRHYARKSRTCPVQLRMSTCQLTFVGIVCQAYQHLSDEHDSAEPLQSSVTEEMKVHVVRMLELNPDVKPMVIYKELLKLHRLGEFGSDLMPTKIQLRNALTYLRSRKLKSGNSSSVVAALAAGRGQSRGRGDSNNSSPSSSSSSSRKRAFDSFSEGSVSPQCDEHRLPE